MLMLRRNEKDFLARFDLKYQEKFQKNLVTLNSRVNQTALNITPLGLEGSQADLEDLKRHLASYEELFNQVVHNNLNVGLDHESGIRGKLRKTVHEVESALKRLDLTVLTVDMLMLRRAEKDFMLRKDVKYLEKFNGLYDVFSADLAATGLQSEQRDAINNKMSAYRAMFIDFVEQHKILGLTPKVGLHGKMRSSVHRTEVLIEKVSTQLSNQIANLSNEVKTRLLILTAVFTIIILALIFALSNSIISRIRTFHNHLSELANGNGDFNASLNVSGKDEVTRLSIAFNQFVENLSTTFGQIPKFSQQLKDASSENAMISDETLNIAMTQQQKSERVVQSLVQMEQGVENIISGTSKAADTARITNDTVIQGKKKINDVGSSISSLAEKLASSAQVVQDLEEDSRNINAVLDTIKSIAEQTNLLALNAAIEAARAGEQGRGFAVVADEVRTLANRTQDSTTQIQSLIESFQANVSSTAQVMEQGSKGASQTVEQTVIATEMLDKISEAVTNIVGLNTGIYDVSQSQSLISNEISTELHTINNQAEETVNKAREGGYSSGRLNKIAADLELLTKAYRSDLQ